MLALGLLLFISSFAAAQDELPSPGQPTPWLDLDVTSVPVADVADSSTETAKSKGPPPLTLSWETLRMDLNLLDRYRMGLNRALAYAEQGHEQQAWKTAIDYALALDFMTQYYGRFFLQASPDQKEAMEYPGSYLAYYAAFMAQSRWMVEWVMRWGKNAAMSSVFDQADPESGLPAGAWSRLRDHLRDLQRDKIIPASAGFYLQLWNSPNLRGFWQRKEVALVAAPLHRDAQRLDRQRKKDSMATDEQGDERGTPQPSWIAQWLGVELDRTALKRMISEPNKRIFLKEALFLNDDLQPGDILLAHRDAFRSDVGLPGYWNDAFLYIGTVEERKRFFGGESVDLQLKNRYPVAYRSSGGLLDGFPVRILRSGAQGVEFTSLEQAIQADAFAAVRPRMSSMIKAEAILRAFGYPGLPYDFDFELDSDAAMTGAELVHRAYDSSSETAKKLKFYSMQVFGRRAVSANDIVRKFDDEFGFKNQGRQLEFVWFIENRPDSKRTTASGVEEFRRSWRRPKWTLPMAVAQERKVERYP